VYEEVYVNKAERLW